MIFFRRAEQFLFYLLLFSIPFQTRIILWQQSWYFNEWQAISIYATDILLLVLLVFWVGSSHFPFRSLLTLKGSDELRSMKSVRFLRNPNFYLVIFIVISALSIKNLLGVFSFIKLIEFVIFYFYLKNYAIYQFGFSSSLIALIAGGLFQGGIAVLQFLKQSDLGLRILGESLLSKDMAGIASFFNWHGEKVVRAYGTAPHPNVLSAYLFLSIFSCYFVWFYKKIRYEYLFWLGYALLLFSFFFTFARVAIFLLGLNFVIRGCLLVFKFKNNFWHGKALKVVWVTGLVIVVFSFLYWPEALSRVKISGNDEAVQLRLFYNKESLSEGFNWLGVGTGNFVNWLMAVEPGLSRHLYQPVHNIYLLIYSETGILGISVFILFLSFLVRDFLFRTKLERFHHYSLLLVFSSFLFMGIFDHFLWTLQQGRFIFWLVLAMLTVDENDDIIKPQR